MAGFDILDLLGEAPRLTTEENGGEDEHDDDEEDGEEATGTDHAPSGDGGVGDEVVADVLDDLGDGV